MYYLIGNPLGHSWSVPIHRALGDYPYALKPIPPEELDAFLSARQFSGLNVTIPYKQTVIPYCDALTETARAIGAVNTVYFDGECMIGHNTDAAGFAYLAHRTGIDFVGRQVYILGSGGTARTVRTVCMQSGAASVTVVSRQGEFGYADLYAAKGDFILINTTPVGMYPNTDASPVDLERLPGCIGLLDVIYNPLRTPLVRAARTRGIPASGGLPMLVAQAAYAAEKFLGRTLEEDIIERTLADITAETANLVLIGMPGVGKTTVGRHLAVLTERRLVDTDEIIAERVGMSIPEIFAAQGEAAFRALEREVVAEVSRERGLVIACGGGAVLAPENRTALRQNGRVYCLSRPIEALATDGRPLSGDLARMREMERIRRPLYDETADLTVQNEGDPEQTADAILADFRRSVLMI